MSTQWRRACSGCTKAKRRCTKQVPSCRRCATRGIKCDYAVVRCSLPAPLPPVGAAAADPQPSAGVFPHEASDYSGSLEYILGETIDYDYELLDFGGKAESTNVPEVAVSNNDRAKPSSAPPWFLLPSSWKHEYSLPRSQADTSASSLHSYADTIRNWFYAWAAGSPTNPLIHRELYRREMPRCVQDAYTAISTYQHRTPENTETVLHIVEARVEQLIQEQTFREGLGDELTMFEHLARVHALLAYQTIRLFDGDIRARTQAEEKINTLVQWSEKLWQSTRAVQETSRLQDGCTGLLFSASVLGREGGTPSEELDLWHAFILFESVRRAFLTVSILQSVYLTLKRGWSACPGGVTISIRQGVWEAKSAHAWTKLVGQGEKDPLLGMQTLRLDEVLAEVRPLEIDDFGIALMGVHVGEERLEGWLDSE